MLKVIPWRSTKYLEFIREQDCSNCGQPAHVAGIDAHHINGRGLGKGMGSKISDIFCIPVCRVCHLILHGNQNEIDQTRIALKMIEKAVQEGVLKC